MIIFNVKTTSRNQLVDITDTIRKELNKVSFFDGICVVFIPHTTAAVTINENADPDVMTDIIRTLNNQFPKLPDYKHMEGNSDAHIKTTLVGSSEVLIIESGLPVLGTWQGIFLCEFDGPRTRKVHLKLIGS